MSGRCVTAGSADGMGFICGRRHDAWHRHQRGLSALHKCMSAPPELPANRVITARFPPMGIALNCCA
jgi:hypothetical protein